MRDKRISTASLPMQPVAPVVHNHAQGFTGPALVGIAFVPMVFAGAWFVLCFLFEKLGSPQPEYSAAVFVAVFGIGAPALWFASKWLGAIADKFLGYKKEIDLAAIEANVRVAQLQYQSAVTGAIGARALDGDYAMARGCLAVLAKAYNIDRPYTANESRPWVRDNAWRLISAAGIQGIKWGDCNGVKGWLEENGFVVGNQLNRVKYPHFEDARRAVDLIAAPPILINPPTLPYRETTSIIK